MGVFDGLKEEMAAEIQKKMGPLEKTMKDMDHKLGEILTVAKDILVELRKKNGR